MHLYNTRTDTAYPISSLSEPFFLGDAYSISSKGEALKLKRATHGAEPSVVSMAAGYVRAIVLAGDALPNGVVAPTAHVIVTFLAGIGREPLDFADALTVRGEAWLSLRCRREGFRAFVGRMKGNGLDGRFGEGVGDDIVSAVVRALFAFDVHPKSPAHGLDSLIPSGGRP